MSSPYFWDGSDTFDRPIAFHRIFIKVAGDVAGAVFLSQLCYWAKRSDKDKDFWFYKSVEEWEEETGLSRDQQLRIRAILRNKNVLEERNARIEHRIYFRLNLLLLVTLTGGVRFGQVEKPDMACRETRLGQVEKPDSVPIQRLHTETTTEITNAGEEASSTPSTDKDSPNFSKFSKLWYHLSSRKPSKTKTNVEFYEAACQKYGEEEVLRVMRDYIDSQDKDYLKKKSSILAYNFLKTEVHEMASAAPAEVVEQEQAEEDENNPYAWQDPRNRAKRYKAMGTEAWKWYVIKEKPKSQRTPEEAEFLSNNWKKYFNK